MEKKPDAQKPNAQQPTLCKNNCYFYGNPLYDNLCSKCFGKQQEALQAAADPAQAPSRPPTAAAAAADLPSTVGAVADIPPAVPAPAAIAEPAAALVPSSEPATVPHSPLAAALSSASTPARKPQARKGRCFLCRARVPLVKQTTNKCRCDYVFCDAHRYPDMHSCEFDFKASDRINLEKHNPKLNEKRKGGLSFTRID
ncbi:hypothetical protein IWQ56_001166 [Coemansia nantahalensis]|nr:hypothetical protein IWQ56_001166 [Coemansia nantahalensis]